MGKKVSNVSGMGQFGAQYTLVRDYGVVAMRYIEQGMDPRDVASGDKALIEARARCAAGRRAYMMSPPEVARSERSAAW